LKAETGELESEIGPATSRSETISDSRFLDFRFQSQFQIARRDPLDSARDEDARRVTLCTQPRRPPRRL